MTIILEKQISIISCDTGNFYSNNEIRLHKRHHDIKAEKLYLVNELKKIEPELNKYKENKDEYKQRLERIKFLKDVISKKTKSANSTKEKLLKLISNKVKANIQSKGRHHTRELKENVVSKINTISVFDSFLTRTLGLQENEFSEDFMVVQVYFYNIIKDLIYYGFTYKGEKYIYFTSSAGQIRTKKTVFIKESVWNKHQNTIMCGLSIEDINTKGGNNQNKHLAYLALSNSSTDIWKEFDIDKAIVIDDFETEVFGTYDLVDETDYSVKRISDYVPIPHTDGAGMILPNAFGVTQKNKMIRLPWVKGLLGVFDFRKFIEVNQCSSFIKDIYGVEHDIIAEDIQVVFTKSQFKMYKYYESWQQYKDNYKKYNCTANYANIEEDRIKNATINYQMLQTLTDITDEEIYNIAKDSINTLNNISSTVNNILNAFGVSPYNQNQTAFQKSIKLYPNLLNDDYVKSQLREIKDSLVKKFKAGKLKIEGKYTFILPDFYAACEFWFMNNKNPNGLLDDGEVFCWLFRKNEKVDCLRSPHLFCEHAIRVNTSWNGNKEKQEKIREWFCTDAVYTSCKDIISKVLMFDVDGDKSLVVANKTLIEVAERNLKKYDIVPLYYNMKKAKPSILNNETIYSGLQSAFSGSNIGTYSNNISKIWNSDIFVNGTDDEKKEAIDVIKLLCMENNFVIDRAKTLYMPERPKFVKELVTHYTKGNVPHFFKYAKDKEDWQVSKINDSFVNKLNHIIPNPRINCRKLGLDNIDYTLLMNNPNIDLEVNFTEKGKLIKETSEPLIVKYCELCKKHCYSISNIKIDDITSKRVLRNSQMRQIIKYDKVCSEIKEELSQFGYNEIEVTDILVKFLYGVKFSKHKMILWACYGDYIYNNLSKNIKPKTKVIQCVDCGEWFEVNTKDNQTCRCIECNIEHKRELTRLRVQKHRREQSNAPKLNLNNT